MNTGALNIRSGPGVSYGVVLSVYRNTVLTLLARNADASWVKVMTTTGVQGWVNARYILTYYPLASLPIEGGTTGGITGVVNSYGLNIRGGPGTGYGVLVQVPNGTVLTLLARNYEATWVKVMLATGTQGWASAPYISTTYPIINLPIEGGTTPPPPPPPPAYRVHVVQPGENLFRIGLRYGVSMYTIAQLNGITNLTLIYVGQTLLIP